MAEKIYRFPYGVNEDGTPKIQARMTPEEYAEYKKHLAEVADGLKKNRILFIKAVKESTFAYTAIYNLDLVYQKCDEFKRIPYPVPSEPTRTVASHGAFQIVVHNVLKHFGKNVSVEDLTKIANYGDWQHDKNGTWHHFVDVVCKAYGLDVVRLGNWKYVYSLINQGYMVVTLLDHKMFPDGHGNSLVLVTGIEGDEIEFYHPRFGEHLLKCGIAHFMLNTKVLWGITD